MGGAQHHRRHGRHHRRLLGWDEAQVPEGGAAVYASATALTLSYWKDPAGHLYHLAALRQAGLYGASLRVHPGSLWRRESRLDLRARNPDEWVLRQCGAPGRAA